MARESCHCFNSKFTASLAGPKTLSALHQRGQDCGSALAGVRLLRMLELDFSCFCTTAVQCYMSEGDIFHLISAVADGCSACGCSWTTPSSSPHPPLLWHGMLFISCFVDFAIDENLASLHLPCITYWRTCWLAIVRDMTQH